MRFRSALLSLVLVAFSLPALNALTISGFTTAENDRFADDDAFILNSFDITGVGRSSDDRWGTLISDKVFLSANHLHPSVGSSLTFHATNNSNGASTTHTVASGAQISGTDLWVGVLSTAVSSGYKTYSFATTSITNSTEFSASPYANAVGAVVGRSPTAFASVIDVAVGYNLLDAWVDDVELTGVTHDSLLSTLGNANDLDYEALLQGGDSGAPLFVNVNSELHLVGINWWVGDVTFGENTFDTNGYTYVGNYAASLNGTISASAVPEPSSFAMLLSLGLWTFVGGRRRRRPHHAN